MLIRHAEKPRARGAERGVDKKGARDPTGLSVRGWQRAGALVRFFAPLSEHVLDHRTPTPAAIFAAAPSPHRPSKRPAQTVRPLAQALRMPVLQPVLADDAPGKLVDAAAKVDGPVLVSWGHDTIADIAMLLLDRELPPWPKERFDLVWVFERIDRRWTLTQVPQMLLAGDCPDTAPLREPGH